MDLSKSKEFRLEEVPIKQIRDTVLESFPSSYSNLELMTDSEVDVVFRTKYRGQTLFIDLSRTTQRPLDVQVKVEFTTTPASLGVSKKRSVLNNVGLPKLVAFFILAVLLAFVILLAIVVIFIIAGAEEILFSFIGITAISFLALIIWISYRLIMRSFRGEQLSKDAENDLDIILEQVIIILQSMIENRDIEGESKKCWNCFAQIHHNDKVCHSCGTQLRD